MNILKITVCVLGKVINKKNCVRNISFSHVHCKVIPNNSKGKSTSSHDWLVRQINDIYVKKSRYDGYRCRSAYKLLEIDEKYKILKPGMTVVDCGASPGSWTQVVVKKLKLDQEDNKVPGVAIAVDLQAITPIKGAILMNEKDFTCPKVQEEIFKHLPDGKAHVILSDMAPKASGTPELDNIAITNLVFHALRFAARTLKKDGTFLCKVWDSSESDKYFKALENLFTMTKRVKPKASRMDSAELFLLGKGFKGYSTSVLNKV